MADQGDIPVQIVLRPYASSLPLACFAFGTGNALYSSFLLHWIPLTEARLVALMLIAFVAPLELGPSLMAFLARDTGGATAFGIFGASWVVQGLELWNLQPRVPSPASAIFLLCLTVCLTMLTIVTFKGKPLLGTVLIVAIIRNGFAAAVLFGAPAVLGKTTAWCGVLLAALSFYSAIAFLEEDVTGEISPLTFRMGEARAAMEGKLKDQISMIEKEAGVRKQL